MHSYSIGRFRAETFLIDYGQNIGFFLVKNVPFATKKAEAHFHKAIELSKEIGARGYLGQTYLSLGLLAAFAVALPMWWFYRRIRGASLRQLMMSAPKSFPEVARILSLIRH